MKILGYIWAIFINIITVGVVSACFSSVSTNFDTIILAILVLIYLSIGTFTSIWSLSQLQLAKVSDERFKVLKKLLTKGAKKEFDENDREEQEELEKAELNTMVKFYIGGVFRFIIYVITLFNLLTAL